jgi:hypothetical protein
MTRDRHQSSVPVRKYKGETVFDWESEGADDAARAFADRPAEARPGAPRPLSSQASLQAQRHRMARRRRSGAAIVWIGLALLALVALIGVAGVIALRGGLRP